MSIRAPEVPLREAATARKGGGWPVAFVAMLVMAAIAVGVWAIIEANQDGELAIATEIVDEWNAAWVANDAEAIGALFIEDGIWTDPVKCVLGRDRIEYFARAMTSDMTFAERLGEGARTGTGSFIFPGRLQWQGEIFTFDIEIELDGDLASRIETLTWVE